jgi:hypothetical protein
VFVDGEQVLAVTDSSLSGGKIEVWDGRNGSVRLTISKS